MNNADIIVETMPVGPLQCNCTILGDLVSRKAIVVDPGGGAEILLERLVELNLQVERIIHTHAHLDHFLASGKMKEATGAKLALHREDLFLWDMLEDQCRMFGIPFEPSPPPDQWLENEEEIDLNDEYFIDRNLYPNVDFYSGIIYQALGLQKEMFTVMFALARTVGWATHWCEMMANPSLRIGRPRQLYLGPKQRNYIPLDQR